MDGLAGERVLVTGGTGLLGGAVTERLLAEGADVTVTARSRERAARAAEDATGLALDLADPESIVDAAEAACDPAPPEIVVANASARDALAPFGEADHAAFERLFGVDVAGHFLLARELVERGEATPRSFVFLSSVYSLVGVDGSIYPDGMAGTPPQYAAAKAGINGLVRHLAARWGARGTRVNAVVAGGVAASDRQADAFAANYGEKTMLGRLARPAEVASAVTFLASAEASYVTGSCLVADGGLSSW